MFVNRRCQLKMWFVGRLPDGLLHHERRLHCAEVEQVDVGIGVDVEGRAFDGYVGAEKDVLESGVVLEFHVAVALEIGLIAKSRAKPSSERT